MKTYRKIIAILLAVGLVLPGAGLVTFAEEVENVHRLAGADRYKTAVAVSEETYTTADAVVLAGGMAEVDALTGTLLAAAKDAPLLYTDKAELTAATKDEIARLEPKTVYVLGGKAAVEEAVVEELETLGYEVERVEGLNRQATAVAVAEKANFPKDHAFIVRDGVSSSLVDALAVAPASYKMKSPVFLTKHDALHPETKEALEGYTSVTVIGGETAVSKAVETELTAMGLKVNPRVAGLDRDKTAVAIANEYFADATQAVLANGHGKTLVDALVGGYLGGMKNAPVLYTKVAQIPTVTENFVKELNSVYVLGGKTVMSAALETAVGKLLEVDELKVVSVSAIKANQIKVVFNKEADVTVAVKRGTIAVNASKVEWNEAKTEATITTVNNMTKGEYTVTAGDLSAKFNVEDQKVTKIEFTSDKAVLGSAIPSGNLVIDNTFVTIGYKLFDQYGVDVTTAKRTEIDWSTSTGKVVATTPGVIRLNRVGDAVFTLDQKVILNGLNTTTGVFASGTFTVSNMAYVATMEFGEVTPNKDVKDTVVYTTNLNKFHIPVVVKDQYGNTIKNVANINANVLPLLVNVGGSFANDADGNVIFNLAAAGTQLAAPAHVTFVGKSSGIRATTTFDVASASNITEFSMEVPSLVVAGDTKKVEVPFTAIDQYGNAVTNLAKLQDLDFGVTGTADLDANDFTFVKDYETNTVKLELNVAGATDGKAYITLVTPGFKVYQAQFDVQKKAIPTVVAGTDKLIVNMVKGTDLAEIKASNIVVNDQYGRKISMNNFDFANYRILLETSAVAKVGLGLDDADTTEVNEAVTELFTDADAEVAVDAKDLGNSTIKATLQKKVVVADTDTWPAVDGSSLSFTATVVKATDVVSYEVKEIGTLWAADHSDKVEDYSKDVVITGKLANGAEVVLNSAVIKSVVSSNTNVLKVADLVANGKVLTDSRPTKDTAASIIVTIDGANGPVIINTPVTVSYDEPVAETVVGHKDNVKSGIAYISRENVNDVKGYLVVTDQYGVELENAISTFVITNVKTANADAEITLGASNKITLNDNVEAGDEFTLTGITANGKSLSIKVVFNK